MNYEQKTVITILWIFVLFQITNGQADHPTRPNSIQRFLAAEPAIRVNFSLARPRNPNAASDFFSKASSYGLPSEENLKICENYILSYDFRLKHATWVLQYLTPERINLEKYEGFQKPTLCCEPFVHEYFRSSTIDYSDSGYDRGHMCPARDHSDPYWAVESFYMSNIVPQKPNLNKG